MKELITLKHKDWRFIASGKTLHYAKDWKVFSDFLRDYLGGLLRKEWGESQLQKAFEQRHPIGQWHTLMSNAMQRAQPSSDGLILINSGAATAWIRLAYDLYLIEHNADLQKKLVRRLRDPIAFQGARFEAAVAAMMLVAGYSLRFVEERGAEKRPEFYATHNQTGLTLAVEAKSRQRDGILGYNPEVPPQCPSSLGVYRILKGGVEKNTSEPLLVFIEVNVPDTLNAQSCSTIAPPLDKSWNEVQRLPWANGFPCVGTVFYNDVSPWHLAKTIPNDGAGVWAYGVYPSSMRHKFDAKPLLNQIVENSLQRCNLPHNF